MTLKIPPLTWRPVVLLLLLMAYGWLRVQVVVYDRKILQAEEALARLRPAVLEVVETKEQQSLLAAHQWFAAALAASTIDWAAIFQQLSTALPPSVVLHTVTIDGPHLALQGMLRYPPAEPQAYLAQVANTLKPGVFRDVMVTVTPPDPDAPTVVRIELTGDVG